jgi:hypothetical protein
MLAQLRLRIVKAQKAVPRTLDMAKLETMVEPLTVQVSKVKGGQFSPIPLPVGESGSPGQGWSIAEVKEMDQGGWLVREWSGGGFYEIIVTDSAVPTPSTLTWRPYWNPAEYPEKIPPTLDSAAQRVPATMPSNVIPLQPQVPFMTQFPAGLPTGLASVPAPAAPTNPYAFAAPRGYDQQFYATQAAEADRRRMEERLAATEAQLRQAQLETQQRQHQAEIERERAANAATIQRLEQRIAEMATAVSKPAVSPEMEALKEQNRIMQQQVDNERREREAERRDRETRELITAMKGNMDQQLNMMREQFQQLMLAQQNNKGTDPMVQLMIEQNRNSVSAMERISMQSSAAIEKFQAFMMSPRDVMAMTKDASNGIDAMAQKMANVYGNVLDLNQKVVETALQLNQGGSTAVTLIEKGVDRVTDLAERYMLTKGKESAAQASAQAQIAQANAQRDAVQAQAQAVIEQTRARAQQPVAPTTPRPAPAQPPSNGLSGRHGNPGTDSFEQWRKQRESGDPAAAPARETVEAKPANGNGIRVGPPRIYGKTDEEWFGPALDEVKQTRQAVNEFIADLKKGQIKPDAAEAAVVAKNIMTAAGVVSAQGLPIPAMIELLFPGKFDEFVEVLLPKAPPQYRADIVEELKKLTGEGDDEEEPDTSFDDGDDNDDIRDGASA